MILAEALREELRALKKFALVDRSDLHKVRADAASQGPGPASAMQAVTMGKGERGHGSVTTHQRSRFPTFSK